MTIRPATLIFDGDDTPWQTHFLYDEAKLQASAFLKTRGLELSDAEFLRKVDELSVRIGRRQGFTRCVFQQR